MTQQGKIHRIKYLIEHYLHAKMQENATQNKEKNQSMEVEPELTHLLKLVDKETEKKILKEKSISELWDNFK